MKHHVSVYCLLFLLLLPEGCTAPPSRIAADGGLSEAGNDHAPRPEGARPDQRAADFHLAESNRLPDSAGPGPLDRQQADAPTPDTQKPDALTLNPIALLKVAPLIQITTATGSTTDFVTIKPGAALGFNAVVTCPAKVACQYLWDFGNGQTAMGKTPASVVYTSLGLFRVKLTVTDANTTVMGQARAVVTVWDGHMTDHFLRTHLRFNEFLWLRPLHPQALVSINASWLHVTHTLMLPGSSAIRAAPLVKDLRLTVNLKRNPLATIEHYSDIIVRMHPQKLNASFYRIRIKEGIAAYNNEVELSVWKVVSTQNEVGLALTKNPPILSGFDPQRKTDMHLKVEVWDDAKGIPTFEVVLSKASDASKVLLTLTGQKDTDTTTPPYSYAGFTGLSHYTGVTDFDDFFLKEL